MAVASRAIRDQGLNIDSIIRLTGRRSLLHPERNVRACIEFSMRGTPHSLAEMQSQLMQMSGELAFDFSIQRDNMFRRMRRLICFDMDSTLIQTECIDELAMRAGVGDKVKAITEEIGFTTDMKAYKADPTPYKGSVADVSMFLRVAVTGSLNSPDMYSVMQILGADRVKSRIDAMLEKLN